MNHLPVAFALELNGLTPQALNQLPEALHILWPIFDLEDGDDCEGWTALNNAGVHGLPMVIAAYERMGLPAEAAVLKVRWLLEHQTLTIPMQPDGLSVPTARVRRR